MSKVTVKDIDFKGKKVIVRVDFNVPLDDKLQITDDARITAAMETIKYILSKSPKKLILMSHLGRPKGKVVDSMRMNPVAKRLSELLAEPVLKLDECVGPNVKQNIDSSSQRVILLENLRFTPKEEAGDEQFAKDLASLADVYVNDAFGTAHRAHASTTVIAKFLPSAIGFLMEKEVNFLSKVAFSPQSPFIAILGGAKVSDKIGVVNHLISKVDKIIIGGAMAYTFLKAKNVEVGNSRVEGDKLDLAKEIFANASKNNVEIVLPVDHLCVDKIDSPAQKKICDVISSGLMGVDVGPKTISLFKQVLTKSKTVLWNGPLGIFENPDYAQGTKEIAEFLATLDAIVVVGGGDSAAAAKEFGVNDKLSHVSTGGGASLEFLEGQELPGVAVISDK